MRVKNIVLSGIADQNYDKIEPSDTITWITPKWRSCVFCIGLCAVVSADLGKRISVTSYFFTVYLVKYSHLKVSYRQTILSAPILTSGDAYVFFMGIWDKDLINLQEEVYFIYLNGNSEVISWRCFNTGTCCQTLFDVKLALASALGCMAGKIIIGHNHPSGKLIPSYDDILVTAKLFSAAQLMDIKLDDHIIVTPRGYYSFTDHHLLKS